MQTTNGRSTRNGTKARNTPNAKPSREVDDLGIAREVVEHEDGWIEQGPVVGFVDAILDKSTRDWVLRSGLENPAPPMFWTIARKIRAGLPVSDDESEFIETMHRTAANCAWILRTLRLRRSIPAEWTVALAEAEQCFLAIEDTLHIVGDTDADEGDDDGWLDAALDTIRDAAKRITLSPLNVAILETQQIGALFTDTIYGPGAQPCSRDGFAWRMLASDHPDLNHEPGAETRRHSPEIAIDGRWAPLSAFRKDVRGRIKKAMDPKRRTKRVRSRFDDALQCKVCSVDDAEKLWPQDVPLLSEKK